MSTKQENKGFTEEIAIPEGVQAELVGTLLKIKGPKGEVQRDFISKVVKLEKKDKSVVVSTDAGYRNDKRMIYTFASHLKNMFNGVQNNYVYRLKVCSGHFPISIKAEKDKFLISNFLGEKVPRVARILENVKVRQEGDVITVEGPDIENTSQTAANLEIATKIRNRDRRRFQDGIYLLDKNGVKI